MGLSDPGIRSQPAESEETVISGRMACRAEIVGYQDSASGYFVVRNSWEGEWGQDGYFQMPYEYFDLYTYDYWIMEN